MLEPSANGLQLDLTIDFKHPAMDPEKQHISVDFSGSLFKSDIASARTFCFLKDVEFMHAHNLALGGSLDNAVVLDEFRVLNSDGDEFRVLNSDGLRYEDEFVKHKLLDCIGDLYMSNKVLLGRFSAYKTGHHLNNQMLRELLAHPECYEVKTFKSEEHADVLGTPIDFISPAVVSA